MTVYLIAYLVLCISGSSFIGSLSGKKGWSWASTMGLVFVLWAFASLLYLGARP